MWSLFGFFLIFFVGGGDSFSYEEEDRCPLTDVEEVVRVADDVVMTSDGLDVTDATLSDDDVKMTVDTIVSDDVVEVSDDKSSWIF